MPKVSAILRFRLPANKTRSLNATQLGDSSETKFVLGTTAAKLKVLSHSKAVRQVTSIFGAATVHLRSSPVAASQHPNNDPYDPGPGRDWEPAAGQQTQWADCGFVPYTTKRQPEIDVLQFTGGGWTDRTALGADLTPADPGSAFIGSISVATRNYKKWLGKTCTLKYDITTGDAALRILRDP